MDRFVKAHDTCKKLGYYIRPNGCWEWNGYLDKDGYGRVNLQGETYQAHRWMYEQNHGPISVVMHCHHTCLKKHCVNPAHLEILTPKEHFNTYVHKESTHRRRLPKTHCLRGHEYNVKNTYWEKGYIKHCRICQCERQRRSRIKPKTGANWIRFVSTVSNDMQPVLAK